MSNKKQTAVEWLESEMLKPNLSMKDIFNQAKAMHKQEIEAAFENGADYEYEYHINIEPRKPAEQYYKETYETSN